MSRPANFEILSGGPGRDLYIRDVGPWDGHLSVTNDVECVVERLVAVGMLRDGMRLYYYDSDGIMDEIVVKDGKFAGFRTEDRDEVRQVMER